MNDFILPDIGEGIVECELLQWLVSEGDIIKEDQVVAEVMTDKATVEIPAMHSGKVAKLYYKEGDIAKVHSPLFAMESANDASIASNKSSTEANKKTANNALDVETNANTTKQIEKESFKSKQVNRLDIESFILPDIGEGIVECEIMQWHINEGESVSEDQVVVEVMTDKAIVEIPAKHPGKIIKLHYKKGDIAAVHSPLFDQEIVGTTTKQTGIDESTNISSSTMSSSEQSVANSTNKQGERFVPPVDIGKALASPAVRRLARENNIDLASVKSTGEKGRVLKADILNAIHKAQNPGQQETTNMYAENEALISYQDSEKHNVISGTKKLSDRVEPIRGIRAAMAKQMVASVTTIPHFTVSDELCMDNLIGLRQSLKASFEQKHQKLSFMPFFVKALSLAMLDFPILNSRLNKDATELTYLGSHNIGVAVDSKVGLLVPNIKNVQALSLLEVSEAFNELVSKARDGKLSNNDLSGGSISISNVGAIGGITATPIINKPDVAIVALGKMQTLPRFNKKGKVFASNIMTVNWSADHRVIDGATMVKFNNLWMEYLMHPEKMLMHLR